MLASYAIKIEGHYSARAGRAMPMDAEWAKDGLDGPLYGVQARPETRASGRREALLEEYRLGTTPQPVVTGRAVGSRIAQGPVRLMRSAAPRRSARFAPGRCWSPTTRRRTGNRSCTAPPPS